VGVGVIQSYSSKEMQGFQGKQQGSSKFRRCCAPVENDLFLYRSRSDGTARQGSSTPSLVVEDIGNSTPDALQVLSSSSLGPEGFSSFDPAVFEASLSDSLLSARVREDGISLVVNRENLEQLDLLWF